MSPLCSGFTPGWRLVLAEDCDDIPVVASLSLVHKPKFADVGRILAEECERDLPPTNKEPPCGVARFTPVQIVGKHPLNLPPSL